MNKNEIIAVISDEFGLSKEQARDITLRVSRLIIDGVKEESKFIWPDLGTFVKSRRSARKGRNPMTGEVIDIAEKDVVKFTPAKTFKEEVAVVAIPASANDAA